MLQGVPSSVYDELKRALEAEAHGHQDRWGECTECELPTRRRSLFKHVSGCSMQCQNVHCGRLHCRVTRRAIPCSGCGTPVCVQCTVPCTRGVCANYLCVDCNVCSEHRSKRKRRAAIYEELKKLRKELVAIDREPLEGEDAVLSDDEEEEELVFNPSNSSD